MRQRVAGRFHSRIFLTLVLAFLMISQGGAAHEIRGRYVPEVISAAYPHSEPVKGYSADGAYGKECLHCHAPVRCLGANLCPDCHREGEQDCAKEDGLGTMPAGPDIYQVSRVEHQGRYYAACDVPAGAINHEQLSGFSLDRHQTSFDGAPITCESCHLDGLYDATTVACAACHAQQTPAYMAEHTTEHGGDCAECHDGRGGTSDTGQGEVHALGGSHEEAGCQDCHLGSTFAEDVRDCADCHEEPNLHAGKTGLRCEWCHNVASWLPARLSEHSFRLDHGGLDGASCEACHAGTYAAYSCYGCHDHQLADLEHGHAQEGIDQLEHCSQCHPTGVMREAARLGYGLSGQSANVEGPELSPGEQSPEGSGEMAPPGQEGEGQAQPAESETGPAESNAGPAGSPEAPVESMTGPTPSLPGEQDPAPAQPSGPDDALSPAPSRGG